MEAIWQPTSASSDAISKHEADATESLDALLATISVLEDDPAQLKAILGSAKNDLRAGCAVARKGYLKQAYTLWRSWLEQALFATYFLEAPLHLQAWNAVDEITKFGTRPDTELMLHQLLDTNKKHPFAVVYSRRFGSVFEKLGASMPGKGSTRHPLNVAEHCLTDLSQGVHGTYRPCPPSDESSLATALTKHCATILQRTEAVVAAFFYACFIGVGEPDAKVANVSCGEILRLGMIRFNSTTNGKGGHG